jgi:hypothetical protein
LATAPATSGVRATGNIPVSEIAACCPRLSGQFTGLCLCAKRSGLVLQCETKTSQRTVDPEPRTPTSVHRARGRAGSNSSRWLPDGRTILRPRSLETAHA